MKRHYNPRGKSLPRKLPKLGQTSNENANARIGKTVFDKEGKPVLPDIPTINVKRDAWKHSKLWTTSMKKDTHQENLNIDLIEMRRSYSFSSLHEQLEHVRPRFPGWQKLHCSVCMHMA